MWKLDGWLIDRLDALMTWAQRRNNVSLVQVHVYVVAAMMLFCTAYVLYHPWALAFNFIFWSAYLYHCLAWARRNAEYQTNWRLLSALNAKVLWYREKQSSGRLVWMGSAAFWLVFDAIDLPRGLVFDVLSWLVGTLMFYLNTSTFVGYQPSQRRETVRNAAEQGAS